MVRCKKCGLLAVRDYYNDAECHATELTREEGLHQSSRGNQTPAKVRCRVGSECFHKPKKLDAASVVEAINELIECDSFRKWIDIKSPKEHEEMAFVERIKAEYAQAHAEEVQRHREWREEDSRRHDRRTVWGIVGTIIAAIISGGLAGWLGGMLAR